MDISKLNIVKTATEGAWIDILNPLDDTPTDMRFHVVGAMSNNYKDDLTLLIADIEDFKEANKIPENSSNKKKAEFNLKVDKYDAEVTAKFLAKYTIGWENVEENGKPLEFSQANAERVYLEYSIIRGQVQKGMMTLSNFIKA